MQLVHPSARAAFLELLARRREVLAAGAAHVGWKLGIGDRESIEGSIAVGYLATATVLPPGGTYRAAGLAAELSADVEVAVQLRRDVSSEEGPRSARDAIGGYAVALELVDLAPVLGDPVAVVASNVFHRAVSFGPMEAVLPEPPFRARVYVGGQAPAVGEADDHLADRLVAAARVLEAADERIRAGDLIISGSIVQVPVAPGRVRAEVSGLGTVELEVAE
jgi:2-keto-4-pentenoate hydratase